MFTMKHRSPGLLASAGALMLCLGALPAFSQTQAHVDNSGNNRVQNQTQTRTTGEAIDRSTDHHTSTRTY